MEKVLDNGEENTARCQKMKQKQKMPTDCVLSKYFTPTHSSPSGNVSIISKCPRGTPVRTASNHKWQNGAKSDHLFIVNLGIQIRAEIGRPDFYKLLETSMG